MDKVEIVFESKELRASFGSKPREVSIEVAEQYVRKGWARILPTVPIANPAPIIEHVPDEDNKVSFMPEDRLIDPVNWITSSEVPETYVKQAKDVGFDFKLIDPNSFSAGSLVLAKLIILSSDLSTFKDDQTRQIRVLLFQKKIPYIYRVETEFNEANLDIERQIIFDTKMVFFASKKYFNMYMKPFGEQLTEWFVEKGPASFWRRVNDILKGVE